MEPLATNNREQVPSVKGGVVPTPEVAVTSPIDMPRRPVDLGSFSSREVGPTVHAEPNTYGLKQIDHADLSTYPNVREVLERLGEISAHIRRDTGLKFDLSRVSMDLCSGDEFAIRAYKEGSIRIGISPEAIDEALTKTHPEHRELVKQLELSKSLALGVFMPTEEKVLLNGDLLKKGNANNLATVMYHELIHAAQYQNFPKFFEAISSYGKVLHDLSQKGLSHSPEYLDAKDSLGACMQLLEGMPTSLQFVKGKEYFPGASDGLGFFHKAWALARTLFTREGWNTAVKYLGGALNYKLFQRFSPHIDHVAYEVPELALLAGKRNGKVEINLPHGVTREEAEKVAKVTRMFSSVNRGSKVTCEVVRHLSAERQPADVVNPGPILKTYETLLTSDTPYSAEFRAEVVGVGSAGTSQGVGSSEHDQQPAA